jgi:hypothetical protein
MWCWALIRCAFTGRKLFKDLFCSGMFILPSLSADERTCIP